jgi:hypothetical protein
LANPPSSAISPNPSFSGTDNTLLPAGSESDPPTDNDIIIDYATGTAPAYALGGYSTTASGDTDANDNTVTLSDGEVRKNVMAGYGFAYVTPASMVERYNTVNLNGEMFFGSTSILYGGYQPNGKTATDIFTGNTLSVRAKNSVGGIANFEFVNFYLPENLKNGETLLKDRGAGINTLHSNGGANKFFPENNNNGASRFDPGLHLHHTGGRRRKDIVAKVITREVRPDAKAIAEDYLSSTVFLGQGNHFIASRGISAAQDEVRMACRNTRGNDLIAFSAIEGGKMRYKNGARLDIEDTHLVAGLASG